jgi:hypothetical protein
MIRRVMASWKPMDIVDSFKIDLAADISHFDGRRDSHFLHRASTLSK